MTEEEKQELIRKCCELTPDPKGEAIVRFNKKLNKEINDSDKVIEIEEFYDIVDNLAKTDSEFTLDVMKPTVYNVSDYLSDELAEIIKNNQIPDDKEIVYDILYLNKNIFNILMYDKTKANFLKKWMKDIVEKVKEINK